MTPPSEPPGPIRGPGPLQRQHRLCEDEIFQLIAAYLDGATLRQLVAQFEIDPVTVVTHLDRYGIERRPHGRKLTDQDVKKAARLYDSGLSTVKVAEHFKVNAETIRKELHKAGVTLRPRRGRRSLEVTRADGTAPSGAET